MKVILMILGLVILSGCGHTDAEFFPYIQKFEQDGRIIITALRVNFGDPGTGDSNQAGICITDFSGPHIIIRREIWNDLDSDGKESLLFHEMGHCVLGRAHKSGVVDMRPISLMSPGIVTATDYKEHRQEYLNELFSGAPGNK